ncbi:unnamed protein product [Pocillopora meandrina]|uniref:Uncharacterized protein n=1 Tax=Pocillopora meandrina TaxID=46732 RepID=A0AAU9XDH5_9CNID|nr:unnamed protein product [Pocillopora meandrina]
MNCLTRLFKRMTLTQEIGLRDVLIPLECVIHLNSELKISQSSQTTSLVPSEKTNLTSTFSLLTIRIMINKWLWLAVMISSKVLSEAEL